MAKRRSAAQKAATRKMLAANRRHRNPSPRKATRRRVRRNPSPVSYARRRRVHRNPSVAGGGSIFSELMSKDGLMMIAAVVGTPTITELAVSYIMPNASGTTRTAVKAGLGLGIAWAVHKYVSKKAGLVVGLVTAGSAVADLINVYMSPAAPSAVAASAAAKTVAGYTSGRSSQNLSGYRVSEPGVVRM